MNDDEDHRIYCLAFTYIQTHNKNFCSQKWKILNKELKRTLPGIVVPVENYYNIMIKGKTKQFHIHNLET